MPHAGQRLLHQGRLGRVGLPKEERRPAQEPRRHPAGARLPGVASLWDRGRGAGPRLGERLQALLSEGHQPGQPRQAGGAVRVEVRHRPVEGRQDPGGPRPQPGRRALPLRRGHRHDQRTARPFQDELDEGAGLGNGAGGAAGGSVPGVQVSAPSLWQHDDRARVGVCCCLVAVNRQTAFRPECLYK